MANKIYMFCILLYIFLVNINVEAAKRISRQKCEEYRNKINHESCIQNTNSEGTAKAGDYPHMALLGYKSDEEIKWSCIGVLISEQYVLTPAHCLEHLDNKPVTVRLGELNITSSEDNANIQDVKVSEIIINPAYKPSYNDIGLIKLENPVQINKYVLPACLPNVDEIIDIKNQKFTKSGWGLLFKEDFPKKPYLLYNKNIKAASYEDCDKIYVNKRKLKNGIDRKSQLCLNEEMNTCQILSGGAFQIDDEDVNCMHKLIGLVSFGRSFCSKDNPEVIVKVSPFVEWIEKEVWG